MSLERTLSIIKPDATKRNITGKIINILETSGLQVIAQKRILMSKAEAEGFYAEHKERSFFADLIKFMISAPVIVQVLEGKDAVMRNRAVMGATDPKKAEKNTIRSDFGLDIEKNSVHGSDSKENAKREISYFFSELELLG